MVGEALWLVSVDLTTRMSTVIVAQCDFQRSLVALKAPAY